MKTAIQQWGNSLAVRIPKAFAGQARVKKGTPVRISLEKGRMVVTPIGDKAPSLKQLLARVSDKNIHAETDWGIPEGKELW
jgi:antitoxin MazE